MKKIALVLLLTSCSYNGSEGMKAFNAHARNQTEKSRIIVCTTEHPGSGYEDCLDAIKNSPNY